MHGRNFARSLQERVLAAALAPRLYPSSDTFGHSTLSSSDQPTLNGLPWTLGGWMAGHGPSWVYILSAWCHVGRVLARGFGGWNEQPDVSICECRVLVTWTPAGWLLLTLSGLWSWFGRSVVSDSLRPHGLQHARLPCPLPSLGLYLSPIASFQGLLEAIHRHLYLHSNYFRCWRKWECSGKAQGKLRFSEEEALPDGSDSKETACNAGDPGSIPVSGRSPGEGNGNPLQYSCLEHPMDRGAWWVIVLGVERVWHDLVTMSTNFNWMTQRVRNLPAAQETQETWVWSLGWEDPLEEEMATCSIILAWRIPWTEESGGL